MEPSDTRDQLKGTSQNKGLRNATSASTNPSPLKDASLAATFPAELDYAHKNSLKGHKASITELTTLPDGRLISGSADGTLIVWRAMTDQELTQAQTEADKEYAKSLPPGTRLPLWDWSSWQVKDELFYRKLISAKLEGHTDGVTSVAILPDARVVSGSKDGTLRIWRERQGEPGWDSVVLGQLSAATTTVRVIDAHQLACGAADGSLCVWSEQSAGHWIKETLVGHSKGITVIERFPNGKLLTASRDGTLRIGPPGHDGSIVLTHRGEGIHSVKVLSDGAFVSVGSESVCMWRLNPEMETWTQAYLGEPRGAKVLPNGDVIGFTDPVGVAIWKCDAEGVWQRALFREDWRDMENLTPLDNGRIVLGTSWMDEGSLRTDLEVIRYKDGELRDEATFTDKYGDADRAYFVLPDGHFAIAFPTGLMHLYRGTPR